MTLFFAIYLAMHSVELLFEFQDAMYSSRSMRFEHALFKRK